MLLPFTDGLIRTTPFDCEMALLADRHYSRRTVGARQFLYNGRKLVLRDSEGTVLFGWMYPQQHLRMDGQRGLYCAIFRNESDRPASEIILEAERAAIQHWGAMRMYTYIAPAKLSTRKRRGREYCPWPPGRSFYLAGWKPLIHKNGKPHISSSGQHLLVKLPRNP